MKKLLVFLLVASFALSGNVFPAFANGLPVAVTDQAGRAVSLDAPAQRVCACFYGQTYAMIALGLSDRLIAIERGAASRPIYALAAPELLELPNVGSQKEFNAEAAIALEPDLMLLPRRLKDAAQTLEAVGIPVALCYPETQESLEEVLVMIATLCGEPERADRLLAYYDETFARIDALTASLDGASRPSVYMGGNSGYLQTAPKGMYQASLIKRAGGVNAADGIEGDYWTAVSYEQLLAMNPDVIVLPCEAVYTAEDVLSDPLLSEISAVQSGAVYAMPSAFEAWDSCIPSGVLGALWLLATLHGELYATERLREDAAAFYADFYGCEIDADLLAAQTSNIFARKAFAVHGEPAADR